MRRILHLIRKEFLELRQDPRLFGIVIMAFGLDGEPLREARLLAEFRRQDLERDAAVELPLSRLVDGTHAALADQPDDLEILGERVEALDARWRPPGRVRRGFGLHARLEEAAGAETLRRVGPERRAALRTGTLPRRPYHSRSPVFILPDTGVTTEGYTGASVANNARISSSTSSPSASVDAISSRSACR